MNFVVSSSKLWNLKWAGESLNLKLVTEVGVALGISNFVLLYLFSNLNLTFSYFSYLPNMGNFIYRVIMMAKLSNVCKASTVVPYL